MQVITKVHLLVLGSLLCLSSCIETEPVKVSFDQLELRPNEGKWFFNEQPFTGVGFKVYENRNSTSEEVNFSNGKKNGMTKRWFPTGQQSYRAFYMMNKLHGTTTKWYANGQKESESNFRNGKVDGVQWQWYPSGKPFKKMNIKDGIEVGMQQAWWESGKLYNNYEAKNGRIFGLKRAKLCHELQKENLVEE